MDAIQQFENQMITNNTIHKINVRFKDFSSRKAIISNNWTIDLTLLKLDISDYLEWDDFRNSSKNKLETQIKSVWQNTVVLMINFCNSWSANFNKRIVLSMEDFKKIDNVSKFVKNNI